MMKPVSKRTHFLSGASPVNLVRTLWKNRSELSVKNIPSILLIFLTPMLLAPLFLLEKLFFSARINRIKIRKDPIFIIGHFRTGTTYLHNLLSQDKQFGFPTTYQCFVPGIFLTGGGFTKKIHKTTLPEKRPMDDVLLDSDLPQEEEFAILAMTPYSYYQCYFFPKKTREFFATYFRGEHKDTDKWERFYMYFARKITFACRGKQLVLKNPVNTARIDHLIKMFPSSKFIYLYRDPGEVFLSTCKLFERFLEKYSFQEITKEEIEANASWVFEQTLAHFQEQKLLLSDHDLTEISYHDLIRDPLGSLEKIYSELQLQGFKEARSGFGKYIGTQADYRPDPASLG
jgi:omega-hydroxy-beta-dihydromenaquinone-9 sulfotransferase